jgi:diguanylate cyclase (GGDEF)-like protein
VRRVMLLLTSLALVLGLGGLAAWTQVDNARRVSRVHGADRTTLQNTVSGLTGQYFTFTFLAAQTAADQNPWSLRPGDPADRALLARLVGRSPLTSFGAALLSLTGTPLTDYTTGTALPGRDDPGYAPLRSALLAGQPGLSSLMHAGTVPVVAFAVPIHQGGRPVGLLVSYADVGHWPLRHYGQYLKLGPTARPYVLDGNGVVMASSDSSAVGRPIEGLPSSVRSGRPGTAHLRLHGKDMVVTYASSGHGWTALTVQDASAYSGALRSGHQRELGVLMVLLSLVVALLVLSHHKRQQALRRLAEDRLYDPLTGLAQRRLFEIRVEAALARQERTGKPVGLLYCDLDAFKAVNDRHGHNAGDALLRLVAERLLGNTRGDDMVARLGGDEFAILVEGTSRPELVHLVDRLYDAVQEPVVINTVALEPRLSIGGAVLLDRSRADELLHEADLAMYQAKTSNQPGTNVVTELGPLPNAVIPTQRQDAVDTTPQR